MACSCGGRTAANSSDTLGYYVILPGGTLLPEGVNPADPTNGTAPYFGIHEANAQVTLNRGGTIKRLKRVA
jgi:hypothetical protein